MKRAEGLALLTRCSDENGRHYSGGYACSPEDCYCRGTDYAGNLATFSRYGRTSAECAPVAWRLAYLVARECGDEVTPESLDHAMGLVVNSHDDVAYMVNQYGRGHYR